MFRFEDPTYLWLLLLVPALVAIRIIGLRSQRKRMALLGNPTLLRTLSPGISRRRPAIKFWLLMAAIALMVVMIARPQTGSSISHEKRQGIQTMICLDISNSMMAQDVAPSRLEKSKIVVEDLVDHFRNDQIGMVVFAGDAFIQLPITSDYVSAKLFLQDIDPSLIGTQGTDMAQAIRLAMQSFAKNGKQGKAIIVITDGETTRGAQRQWPRRQRSRASASSSSVSERRRELLSPSATAAT